MAAQRDIWKAVQDLDRLVFTTREIAALTGSGLSAASQGLARLERSGVVQRMMPGLWALVHDRRFSPFLLVPFLCAGKPAYVSFVSALHIHGMIGQIPRTITVASTAHTKKIVTPAATFQVHQLEPGFFDGFEWVSNGQYLVATSEKALVDSLYIASRRGKRYSSFPELEFPRTFSSPKARGWLKRIRNPRLRASVAEKLENILRRRSGANLQAIAP